MDADQTHRIEDAIAMVNAIGKSDLVIGSRYINSGSISGWSLPRLFLTHLGHLATSIFFGSKIDMSSGLRLYRIATIPISDMEKNCPADYEYFFTSAILYLKLKLHVTEVPVLLNQRGFGKSKMTISLMKRGITRLFLFGFRIKRIKLDR
jgi:dolichol-phosphate mannosyltransferase